MRPRPHRGGRSAHERQESPEPRSANYKTRTSPTRLRKLIVMRVFCRSAGSLRIRFFRVSSGANVEPGVTYRAGRVTNRARTFRKHRRPCGQPAVEGGLVRFRPVPAQAGHFARIKAIPSDLPFKSTGFAIYPAPPQFGQSLGPNPLPPHVVRIVQHKSKKFSRKRFSLRITHRRCMVVR